MITIKHEFIRDVMPKIGSDAYTVFSAILSHAGKSDIVWPGIERLKKMCTIQRAGNIVPMPDKRLYAAIKILIDQGLAIRFQERKSNGDFGRRKFKIGHDLVGVTMFGDQEFFEGDSRLVENGEAPNGEAQKREALNDQTEETPKIEELPKYKELPKVEARENAHAKNPEKNPKKEKPELTAEATKNNTPPVAAHPPRETIDEVMDKAQKIISAQSDRPPHENDFPKSDSDLKKIVGVPTPEQASEMMIEYYLSEGWGTWERWLYAAGAKPEEVDMKSICIGWTDKNCDNPLILRNWKKESRKNLLNWIKNELRSNRQHQAKIKSLNNGKKRSSTDPLISSEAMEKAYRELMAEGYR